jgi:hypothetical protein
LSVALVALPTQPQVLDLLLTAECTKMILEPQNASHVDLYRLLPQQLVLLKYVLVLLFQQDVPPLSGTEQALLSALSALQVISKLQLLEVVWLHALIQEPLSRLVVLLVILLPPVLGVTLHLTECMKPVNANPPELHMLLSSQSSA